MLLGERARRVLHLVLRQGLVLVGAGVVAGGVLALLATRVLASMLYGIGAADPITYLVTSSSPGAMTPAVSTSQQFVLGCGPSSWIRCLWSS